MDQIDYNVACFLIFLSIYDALPQVYPDCLFYGQNLVFIVHINEKVRVGV